MNVTTAREILRKKNEKEEKSQEGQAGRLLVTGGRANFHEALPGVPKWRLYNYSQGAPGKEQREKQL